MEIQDMYNPDFVDQVRSILEEECINGLRVTKGQLLERLGLAIPDDASKRTLLESIVGGVVTLGLIKGYDSQPGIGGGFGLSGVERPKSGPTFPEGFVTKLQQVCDMHVTGGRNTNREELAKKMGIEPTPKNLNLISAAFKGNHVKGYSSKRGKGGITKDVTSAIVTPDSTPSPVTDISNEIVNDDAANSTQLATGSD